MQKRSSRLSRVKKSLSRPMAQSMVRRPACRGGKGRYDCRSNSFRLKIRRRIRSLPVCRPPGSSSFHAGNPGVLAGEMAHSLVPAKGVTGSCCCWFARREVVRCRQSERPLALRPYLRPQSGSELRCRIGNESRSLGKRLCTHDPCFDGQDLSHRSCGRTRKPQDPLAQEAIGKAPLNS